MTPEQQRVEDFGKAIGWTRKLYCWLDAKGMVIADNSWNPFNNVADAMIPFQELRESHNWCCLKIDCDYNYATYISLTASSFSGKNEDHKPNVTVQETEGGLANLAELICKAVMKAKEYEQAIKSRP